MNSLCSEEMQKVRFKGNFHLYEVIKLKLEVAALYSPSSKGDAQA